MTKVDLTQFDHQKAAKLDAEMWRSYYNHQFFKLFWQLLGLIKTQLRLNWFTTVRLAYYSAWAATDYRIHRGNVNSQRVRRNLVMFYKIVSDHATEPFDYQRAGELELVWWDIHRKSYENSEELEQSLANAAAAMYNIDPDSLREYAHYRAKAMILPRHVSDAESFTDWPLTHELLQKAWSSLHATVQKV